MIPGIGLKVTVKYFKNISIFSIQTNIQGPTVKADEGNSDLY